MSAINKWIVEEPLGRRKGCLIGLPGRGISADNMMKFCCAMNLSNSLTICLEPNGKEWYPQPNGANDQEEAIAGLKTSIVNLNKKISKIQRAFRLKRSQIALVGFSAGAVMSLQALVHSKQPFAAVASMAGAVLEPTKIPLAPHQTPVLLRHAIDDLCFSWEERYLPMRNAFLNNGYNVACSEKPNGGHGVDHEDVRIIGMFIGSQLGYKAKPEYYDTEDDDEY